MITIKSDVPLYEAANRCGLVVLHDSRRLSLEMSDANGAVVFRGNEFDAWRWLQSSGYVKLVGHWTDTIRMVVP